MASVELAVTWAEAVPTPTVTTAGEDRDEDGRRSGQGLHGFSLVARTRQSLRRFRSRCWRRPPVRGLAVSTRGPTGWTEAFLRLRGRLTGGLPFSRPCELGNLGRSGDDYRSVRTADVAAWLGTAARLLLGGVWVVAGVLKLPDPAAAVRAVRAYRLLPELLVGPVAFGLPVVEVAIGLVLLAGVAVRAAAVASSLLLTVFIAAVASAWSRGLQIDCGCFGGGGQVGAGETAYLAEVLRDAGLLAVALAVARWPRSRLALIDRVPGRSGNQRPTGTGMPEPGADPTAETRGKDSRAQFR
jgi:uncharacterized membrane protein YphA (DoxX/SURF4 family)